jgi:hypothetical protein
VSGGQEHLLKHSRRHDKHGKRYVCTAGCKEYYFKHAHAVALHYDNVHGVQSAKGECFTFHSLLLFVDDAMLMSKSAIKECDYVDDCKQTVQNAGYTYNCL